jgi:hypothetical protein
MFIVTNLKNVPAPEERNCSGSEHIPLLWSLELLDVAPAINISLLRSLMRLISNSR